MQTHLHSLKRSRFLIIAANLLFSISNVRAEEPPLRDLLRDGLYAEEVSRDPEAAAKQYEQLLTRFSEQRDFAASALFRLAEVRRKQDRKEEAIKLYQRLLAEFPGAEIETKIARENLATLGGKQPEATAEVSDPEEKELARLQAAAKSAPDVLLDPQTLAQAAGNNMAKVVKMLLAAGSSPFEGYALQSAASSGNLDVIKQLLSSGQPVPPKVATDAIWTAIQGKRYTVLEFLLDQGLKPGKPDNALPMLAHALLNDYIPSAEILLKHGADLNEMADGRVAYDEVTVGTPLHLTLRRGKFEAAAWLLEKGAKPDLPDPYNGLSPLNVAAGRNEPGTLQIMEKLLAAGADPNLVSTDPEMPNTPLETAIVSSAMVPEKVRLLLKHGANPNRKDSRVSAVLVFAISRGADPVDSIEPLAGTGFKMDSTELMSELIDKKGKIIKLLLQNGANPNFSLRGKSLLSKACSTGDPELLEALIAAGADLKLGGDGNDLFRQCVQSKTPDAVKCIELLVKAGLEPGNEWKSSGFNGASSATLHYLASIFTIPALAGTNDISLVIDQGNHLTTTRIAAGSSDAAPPDLAAWLCANHQRLEWMVLQDQASSVSYRWNLWKKGADGVLVKKVIGSGGKIDFPKLEWGDVIELQVEAEGSNYYLTKGFPEAMEWSLRQLVSFPIHFEIAGEKSREMIVRGDRIVFDPTKNEVPLMNTQEIVEALWQPLIRVSFEMEIVVSRKGWPDVHLVYGSKEASNFYLQSGDRVKLELTDQVRENLAKWSPQFVTLKVDGYPYTVSFSSDQIPEGLGFPTLIQALVETQSPSASRSKSLVGRTSLDPAGLISAIWSFSDFTLLPHPDLSSIRIRRISEGGKETVMEVNLAKAIAAAGDATTPEEARKSDVILKAGDVVELSLVKDRLNQPWKGFSPQEESFFAKVLAGRMQAADESGKISILNIDFKSPRYIETEAGWIPVPPGSGTPSARASWLTGDSTTKVKRGNVTVENSAGSVFLRDGDEILLSTSSRQPRGAVAPPIRVPR